MSRLPGECPGLSAELSIYALAFAVREPPGHASSLDFPENLSEPFVAHEPTPKIRFPPVGKNPGSLAGEHGRIRIPSRLNLRMIVVSFSKSKIAK